jgi:hypothetical protein
LSDVDALRGATGDRVCHLSRHVGPRCMTRRSLGGNANHPCKPWTMEAISGRRRTLIYYEVKVSGVVNDT